MKQGFFFLFLILCLMRSQHSSIEEWAFTQAFVLYCAHVGWDRDSPYHIISLIYISCFRVIFLGYVFSCVGKSLAPQFLEKGALLHLPKIIRKLQSFCGFLYLVKYICFDYALRIKPLYDLIHSFCLVLHGLLNILTFSDLYNLICLLLCNFIFV